jgi:hypothetical protein
MQCKQKRNFKKCCQCRGERIEEKPVSVVNWFFELARFKTMVWTWEFRQYFPAETIALPKVHCTCKHSTSNTYSNETLYKRISTFVKKSCNMCGIMYLWAIYIFPRSVHLFCYIAFAWEYINRSQIHECRNWERGHAVLFLGIFV